jgi:hypothetical protein
LESVATVFRYANSAFAALQSTWKALKGLIYKRKRVIMALEERTTELEFENRSLKDEIARKNEIIGPLEPYGYFFYKDRPNEPLCPKCTQSLPSHPVNLSPIVIGNGGSYRECIHCHWQKYESSEQPVQPVRMGRPGIGSFRNR